MPRLIIRSMQTPPSPPSDMVILFQLSADDRPAGRSVSSVKHRAPLPGERGGGCEGGKAETNEEKLAVSSRIRLGGGGEKRKLGRRRRRRCDGQKAGVSATA